MARSSYVDPKLLDRFREGATIALPRSVSGAGLGPRQRIKIERQVLALLG